MCKTLCFLCLFITTSFLYSQTLSGKVFDIKTKQPLMAVSIYFDNTTIGTTTDEFGNFNIEYSDAIQSNLIISYLGYETVIVSDYRSKSNITVKLKEALNQLNEVVVYADDGLSRKQKIKLFRKQFLGFSKFSKSCRILNEEDLILRYNKKDNTLTVSAKKPVLVKNRSLQYEITYDIVDFEIAFRYVDPKLDKYSIQSVLYTGTAFYKDLNTTNKRSISVNREKSFKGSVQHFMRSLFDKNLRKEGFDIFYKRLQVDEWQFFKVEDISNSSFKKVALETKVDILFKLKYQSVLKPLVTHFYVDKYGNYSPIKELLFGGVMGDQRIGDLLPINYGLGEN